jgi:hypothetical protein
MKDPQSPRIQMGFIVDGPTMLEYKLESDEFNSYVGYMQSPPVQQAPTNKHLLSSQLPPAIHVTPIFDAVV